MFVSFTKYLRLSFLSKRVGPVAVGDQEKPGVDNPSGGPEAAWETRKKLTQRKNKKRGVSGRA